MTVDDLIMLSGVVMQVLLPARKHHVTSTVMQQYIA
jgi:hypothetical protein